MNVDLAGFSQSGSLVSQIPARFAQNSDKVSSLRDLTYYPLLCIVELVRQ